MLDKTKTLTFQYLDQFPDSKVQDSALEKLLKEVPSRFLDSTLASLLKPAEKPVEKKGRVWKILFIGVDQSGKTTALNNLKLREKMEPSQTIGFNVETVETKHMSLEIWDLGGSSKVRTMWSHYFSDIRAICYFVDGSDYEKMNESFEVFQNLLTKVKLNDCPFVIFANKSDLLDFDLEKVKKTFHLDTLNRPCKLFGVCATTPSFIQVFEEAIQWLCEKWALSPKK